MGQVVPLHDATIALADVRGSRSLQVTWHDDAGLVVLSLWRHGECVGTVRVDAADAAALAALLVEGLERRERAEQEHHPHHPHHPQHPQHPVDDAS